MSLIVWAAAGVVAMLFDRGDAPGGHDRSLIAVAVVSMAFGAWAFWTSGGPRITAAGLYCLSMSVFSGFAAAWWWDLGRATDGTYAAALAGWWTTFAMYAIFWRKVPTTRPVEAPAADAARWGIQIGLTVSVAGFALGAAGFGNIVQFSLGGLALVMVSLILHRTRGGRITGPLFLTALVVLAFWMFVFSGAGRLNLVALSLVGFALASMRLPGRGLKSVIVLATAPAVTLLALLDARYTDSTGSVSEGLASVVNPLRYFGELVDAHGQGRFAFGGGDSFLATLSFWVPRDVWAGKPDGFGTVLTDILRPQYRGSGYSLAALSYGEWFYNFGWIGLVAMIVVIGFLVRKLDHALLRLVVVDSRRSLLALTALLLMVAAIPTFAWVGSFTYAARTGQQLIPLAVLALPFASRARRPRENARLRELRELRAESSSLRRR